MAKFPLHPSNPERICWGCEKFCPADDMACGNGTIRGPHPCELMGEDWYEWLQGRERSPSPADADQSKHHQIGQEQRGEWGSTHCVPSEQVTL